jgi:para-aminobenzoate synthetase component 1
MTISRALPLVEELTPLPEPEAIFLRLAPRRHCLFLDSAMQDPALGRYSFLAAEPFDYFECPCDVPGAVGQVADLPGVADRPGPTGSLGELARRLARYRTAAVEGLPPFQGGAAGLLSYDLGRQLESLPRPAFDEFRVPALAMGLYDVVIALDHVERRGWIISQGFPELEPAARARRATQRLDEVRAWLAGPVPERRPGLTGLRVATIPAGELAPQWAVAAADGLTSNFSPQAYDRAVRRAIEYVFAGDIFQVNLAQRLLCPARADPVELYLRLRERNPAPFAGYFDLGEFQIASASPERFLKVCNRWVEARPIKGTRPRTRGPEADLFAGDELRESPKDRAENVMIVDLLRNDLSRVCEAESVHVTQLCGLEVYRYVQHLVSAVCGRLGDGQSPIELVRAAFPGGSVTGAPKVRAMEIIAELEPTARGAYCGSLGYAGFDGSLDLSILIRTITAGRGWWQAPVGGGIVAQSVPEREYQETWDKAEGLLRAMR